ncbi:hypothetical protein RSK20926_20750 [Roseobacter sp. SK209-2-6]|uniref:molybdopterin-dependent oxidoreductase n=1 Tax=Roseobacter sp. SK209-2-6 TaxID=388739 RepID=UPI0000F3E7A2|nr:molybdopterin-dependent oxidoreductase [Roseobacter sp. SK209-2-6]EBA16194.1 hypothetical protein RSK20926_20750 [Roseobacter sp. SK209-2-6]
MKTWIKSISAAVLGSFVLLASPVSSDSGSASAASAAVNEEVLLTVQLAGAEDQSRRFTLADLRALDAETFETETIWTEGNQVFTGVPLATLVALFGVEEGTLEARAVNDYMVEIPISDAVTGGPIIAYTRNGGAMSLRNKGPLWLVYPYDSNPASYKNETVYSRSIWQLDRLRIVGAAN